MQREMVDILRDDDVREQALTGERFLNGLGRRRRFDDSFVALRTGVFRTDRFDDDKARRFVFEFLGDVLANARPGLPAGTLFLGVRDVDLHAAPRQVRRQRPPSRGWRA